MQILSILNGTDQEFTAKVEDPPRSNGTHRTRFPIRFRNGRTKILQEEEIDK